MSDRRQTKTITLKKPFQGADGPVTEIVVQEPTGMDYFRLGHPQTWVKATGGMALVDNDEAIAAYTEKCIIKPNALLAMRGLSVLDAIAVKDAIVGFFRDETPST